MNPSSLKNIREVEIDEDDEIRAARVKAMEMRKKRHIQPGQKPYLVRTNLKLVPLF